MTDEPISAAAASAESAENDPSAVARAVFAALAGKRWSEAASHCEPGDAEAFKAAVIESAIQEESRRAGRLRQARDPARIAPDLGTPHYQTRFGVASVDEMTAMSALALIARMAEIQDPHGPLSGPGAVPANADAGSDVTPREVIGHVFESPDTAHVVYKRGTVIGDRPRDVFAVLTLQRSGGSWRTTGFFHFQNFAFAFPPD